MNENYGGVVGRLTAIVLLIACGLGLNFIWRGRWGCPLASHECCGGAPLGR